MTNYGNSPMNGIVEANTPNGDSLEIARIKQRLRPGCRLSATKKAELRRRLAELQEHR